MIADNFRKDKNMQWYFNSLDGNIKFHARHNERAGFLWGDGHADMNSVGDVATKIPAIIHNSTSIMWDGNLNALTI